MSDYDVLIIGAGQAGVPLARRLAKEGRRTALAERRHLGGSCVNFGCTPTKAVIASARIAHLARRANEFGVTVSTVSVDFAAVIRRARDIVGKSVHCVGEGLEDAGATILRGHARFTGGDVKAGFTLVVGDTPVTADQVVLDTGTRTALPPIDGLHEIPFLHAGNWLASDDLPEKLVIAGGGYIGLEMAQFYRRCGSEVCVVACGEQVADKEDPDVAAELQRLLEAEGITFHTDHHVTAVRRQPDGTLAVTLRDDHGDSTHPATHLFIATGRRPNTDDLGLDAVGVALDDKGNVEVDERLATTTQGIWAAGDVRGGPLFTHAAWDDHRVLESQLLEDGARTTKGRIIPYAIFTDPELGRVGLSERDATKQHGEANIKVARFDLKKNGRAHATGEPAGFIKLIADRRDDRLLGAAVLGVEGAELVTPYVVLMNSGATLEAVCRAVFIHPTLGEAVQSAVSELDLGLKAKS